jgi:uncharacterized protein YgbK (DUF1537 family)
VVKHISKAKFSGTGANSE